MSAPEKEDAKKGNGTGKAWSIAALVVVLFLLGVPQMLLSFIGNFISVLVNGVNSFFMVMKMNAGPIMGVVAIIFLIWAAVGDAILARLGVKKKDAGDEHH